MLSCPSACGLMQQYSWFHSYHWWHHHLDCHWVAAAGSDVEVDGVPVGALTSSAFLLSQLAPSASFPSDRNHDGLDRQMMSRTRCSAVDF